MLAIPSRELRGRRYAEGVHPELVRVILDELPYASYDKACKWYSHWLPLLDPQATRLLGCNDRYFLLSVVLNRPDVMHPWLYDRCREVEQNPDGYLDLWARMHYKSTIITFAGAVQEILVDPEIRIGIFSNTQDVSRPFLRQIQEELENNEYLKGLFTDVLYDNPRKESPLWSSDKGIIVKRKSNPKEATVEAWGVIEKMPVGRHFPLLIFDDTITEANVTNPEQIAKATRQIQLSDNLGVIGKTRKWFIGTRYSYADTYGELIEDGAVVARIYPATEDGTMNGVPVLLTPEDWADRKRAQRTTLAAQMLLNPVAGNENTFRMSYLDKLHFFLRPAVMRVYIMGDPSAGRHKSSDRTAIAVVGVDSLDNRYLLDGYCHRMPQSERWQKLLELHRKWDKMPGVQSVDVGWERYGMQEDLEYFEREMRNLRYSFTIKELAWTREGGSTGKRGLQSKKSRVGRLEPNFRLAKFYLPGKVWHPSHGGTAVWKVIFDKAPLVDRVGNPVIDTKTGEQEWGDVEESARIEFQPWRETSEEAWAKRTGQPWRVFEPLRRVDEDGNIYDMVRVFFEEYRLFPFATHDDLIDAMSRLYDMDVTPATKIEKESEAAQPYDYPDG